MATTELRTTRIVMMAAVITMSLLPAFAEESRAETMRETCAEIVSQYKGVFTAPPKHVPTDKVVDGPILGNGDVGVVISGAPEKQRFWISKCDFWKARPGNHKAGGPVLLGGIDVLFPELADATYHAEQILYEPEIVSTFRTSKAAVEMRSWVAASENLLIIQITCTAGTTTVDVKPWAQESEDSRSETGTSGDVTWVTRKLTGADLEWPSEGCVAVRSLGAKSSPLELRSGESVTVAASILTNHDTDTYLEDTRKRISRLSVEGTAALRSAHEQWWRDFWSKSFIQIGDPLLEKFWYGSHYIMASCSRNKNFPPGLFGNWITSDRPAWQGDYHMNYNHESPWWGVYSSNHVELADPYDTPVLEFVPRGKFYAKIDLDCRGVYYPVGIGPKGLETTLNPPDGDLPADGVQQGLFFGQKSNAAYGAVNMLMRFYHTYDRTYARDVAYPYVIEVANFWEDYLKLEDSRYVIHSDSIHEGSGGDMNSILSLGLVRMLFKGVIEMSGELKVDEDRRATWRHILENMSEFPLQTREGKTVFRYSEEGTDWFPSNTLGIQHIWPAGTIGLDSSPELLKVSRDTITVLNRWTDYNGFPTFFTAAARVGYDPKTILEKLRIQCGEHSYPNLFVFFGGGGIECCSAVPSSINEMLLQSHENILRLFPVWPKDVPARFAQLRAVGAYLVSSAYERDGVQYVTIVSEKGRNCKVQNPWPGKRVTLFRNGQQAEELSGDRLAFSTSPGERIMMLPAGVSPEDMR